MDDSNKQDSGSVLISSSHLGNRKKCRRILSQVCATIAHSLLLLDLGMMVAVPTIVIGVLHNSKEHLSLNDTQASWFGSIIFLVQPLGCILSGCVQGMMGRKRSMLIANIPHLVAWYMLYSAQSVATLYAAALIMGVGMGFLEAPTLAYMGEISEPSLRGMLSTFVSINVVNGHLLAFMFGCFLPWRQAMLLSCSVPVIAFVAITMIPESPVWLLTKNRKDEAMASLKWLRGWVTEDEVSDEFKTLEIYCRKSKNEVKIDLEAEIKQSSDYNVVPVNEDVAKKGPGFVDDVKDLFRREILIPLRLVIVYFFFFHSASLTALRPYMIEVFSRLEVPLTPKVLTVVSATLQVAGALTCICLIRAVGKRALSLVSMAVCASCCLSLGAYTFVAERCECSVPTVPLIVFCTLYFSMSLGIGPVPWLLISEVFPTRGRGVASGVCAALYYVFAFFLSKTWFNLQSLLELQGSFLLYGVLGGIGVVFIYVWLPETEGRTLADIEKHFSRKTKN